MQKQVREEQEKEGFVPADENLPLPPPPALPDTAPTLKPVRVLFLLLLSSFVLFFVLFFAPLPVVLNLCTIARNSKENRFNKSTFIFNFFWRISREQEEEHVPSQGQE